MTRTFGAYGGRYVPETLIPALDELEAGWREAQEDAEFANELHELYTSYGGRPTPLTLAPRFAPEKRVYLKREDLLHTGAHKLNNAFGQALLARRLGKRRIVAETGAGQHGVATATVCARFGFECVVYMGSEDMRRQRPNEERLPEAVVACVGGGSNAIGIFAGFLDDGGVELVGVEAAGASSLVTGHTGVLHG